MLKLSLIHSNVVSGDIVTKYKQLYGCPDTVYTATAHGSGDVTLHKEVRGKIKLLTSQEILAFSGRFLTSTKVAVCHLYEGGLKVGVVSSRR